MALAPTDLTQTKWVETYLTQKLSQPVMTRRLISNRYVLKLLLGGAHLIKNGLTAFRQCINQTCQSKAF